LGVYLKLVSIKPIGSNTSQCGPFTIEVTTLFGTVTLNERMIESINEQGGNGKLIVYEVDGHDADVTYQNIQLYQWLLSL